jgi:hypothetical protein
MFAGNVMDLVPLQASVPLVPEAVVVTPPITPERL